MMSQHRLALASALALVALTSGAPRLANASYFYTPEHLATLCASDDIRDQDYILAYITGMFDSHRRFAALNNLVALLRRSHLNVLWSAVDADDREKLVEERDGFLDSERQFAQEVRICVPPGSTNEDLKNNVCAWILANEARPEEAGIDWVYRAMTEVAPCPSE